MTKFNVGDVVRVLDGSNILGYHGSWVDGMEQYVGGVYTVKSNTTLGDGYALSEIPYVWDGRGLELVSESNNSVLPNITNVIFNNPATIVFWEDGTKTVVKCQKGDKYDKEHGLAVAIAKKALGNKGNFNEVFKKWC